MRTSQYKAKEAYDEAAAANYDAQRFTSARGRLVDWLEKRALSKALQLVPPAGRILDIPCGTGRITEFLLEKGHHVSGADISQAMLRVSAERLKRAARLGGLCALDAERMPFRNEAFEGIVCVRLAGHLPPPVRLPVLSEMRRVTSTWIIVTYYVSNRATDLKRRIKYLLRPRSRSWFPVSEQGIEREMRSAGLRVVGKVSVFKYVSEACMVVATADPTLPDSGSNCPKTVEESWDVFTRKAPRHLA